MDYWTIDIRSMAGTCLEIKNCRLAVFVLSTGTQQKTNVIMYIVVDWVRGCSQSNAHLQIINPFLSRRRFLKTTNATLSGNQTFYILFNVHCYLRRVRYGFFHTPRSGQVSHENRIDIKARNSRTSFPWP